MTNLWKRSISLFLAFVMVFGMLPVNAFATDIGQNTEETSVTDPVVEDTTEASVETTEAPEEETTAPDEGDDTSSDDGKVTDSVTAPAVTDETVNGSEETDETVTETTETVTEPVPSRTNHHIVPEVDLPDQEDLFAGYVQQQFYEEAAVFGSAAGNRLSGDEKLAYNALVSVIKQIASGQWTSTQISIGARLGKLTFEDGTTGVFDAEIEVAFSQTDFSDASLSRVLNALLTDLPYELYWFDKGTGVQTEQVTSDDGLYLAFSFTVAPNYQGSSALTTDTSKTGAAVDAAAYAATVVNNVAADENVKTDYDKLVAYRDWICAAVSYNHDAADNKTSSVNNDPWQMIYVFDQDGSTNVVCEGYSKAFQYLCDLTDFDGDVICYTVSGVMTGGTGAGNHMWNIVEIDGNRYLVDVTNSDAGSVGQDGSLFLVGGTADAEGRYTFGTVSFAYDEETISLWSDSDALTLAAEDFDPEAAEEGSDPGVASSAETALREGLAATSGVSYTMTESVTLTDDLTVNIRNEDAPYVSFVIPENVTLTVPSGVTLKMESYMDIQGELVLEDGATFVIGATNSSNYTDVSVWGKLTAASGATVTIRNAAGITLQYGYGTITGIDTRKIVANLGVSTLDELKDALSITGYNNVQSFADANITIAENLTIPSGYSFYCTQEGRTITIAAGGHLTVEGFFSVQNGATLKIENGGTLTIDSDTGRAISYGGIIDNQGTINGYFQINSEGGAQMSEADFISAIQSISGHYNLADHVVITGDVTIPENLTVWVTETGSLTVAEGGKLTVSNRSELSTGSGLIQIDGTLVNNGFVSLSHGGNNARVIVSASGELQNNLTLSVLSGTLTLDGTYTAGTDSWVDYEPQATITNIEKIDKSKMGLMDIVYTEEELRSAVVKQNGYADQSVYINDDITLTSALTLPNGVGLQIGFTWYSEDENQYGLTIANGATLINDSYIHVGEKFYLHVNSGATLVNNGEIWVNGSYECNGTLTGNEVQIQGGSITQEELEAKIEAANGEWVEVTQSVTLERDLTIDNQGLSVSGQCLLIVPDGVTLTVNTYLSIYSMVVVESGGKLVMGPDAIIEVDGAGGLTIQSGSDISGIVPGHIHQYMRFGATVDGLDKSYIEVCYEVDSLESMNSVISEISSGYHSGRVKPTVPFEITGNVTIPSNVSFEIFDYYEISPVNMGISGTVTNLGAMVIGRNVNLTVTGTLENQGDINVNSGGTLHIATAGSLTNNGGLYNRGGTITVDGAYENNGNVQGDVTVGGQMTQDELEAALADCVANNGGWVQDTKVTLERDMTIDLGEKTFFLEEGGWIIVSSGVTLTVNSYVELNGGKLIVLDGGRLVVRAPMDTRNGIMFFETGSSWDVDADIYGQRLHEEYGDTNSGFSAYRCDINNGVTINWSHAETYPDIMPGMWFAGLFCIREFDKTNYEWKNHFISPDELTVGDHLTVMALADTENPPSFAADDEYVDYYTTVISDWIFADSTVSCTYHGETYTMPVEIGPGNHAFFSQPDATLENYLGFGYNIDLDAEENAFYYIFTNDEGFKIESFNVVNNPSDLVEVEQVEWEKISDTVYKITVKPEYWTQRFPVHVEVKVSHPNNTNLSSWGVGQLWVEPPESLEPKLVGRFLDNNGQGWFENDDRPYDEVHGMWAMGKNFVIFYKSVWDETNGMWVNTPVIPTENSDYLTITPIAQLKEGQDDNRFVAGEENTQYYVMVQASGTMDETDTGGLSFIHNGQTFSQPFMLWRPEVGWFAEDEVSMDSLITVGGGNVNLDPEAEENAFYLKTVDPDVFYIDGYSVSVYTHEEDYDQYVSDGEFLERTMEDNGTLKFTVDPEFVALTRYVWKDFCIGVDVSYRNESGNRGGNWHGELWINPPEGEMQRADAEIVINDQSYQFFEGVSYPITWVETDEVDDQGRVIWRPYKVELPEGVSYDLTYNTLSLEDATTLNTIEVGYYHYDENGNVLSPEVHGARLPGSAFTLELLGENTIDGPENMPAILIHSGVTLNVTGDGSLKIFGNGENYRAIDITPEAKAHFHSGNIELENSNLFFGGIIDWNGTTLNGYGANVHVDQDMTMRDGTITLNGGMFNVASNLTLDGGEINLNDAMLFSGISVQPSSDSNGVDGGDIVLNDVMLFNSTSIKQNGGSITINNYTEDIPSLVNFGYYALNDGSLTIDHNNDRFAMDIKGTFHQMGGTVDISGSSGILVATSWDGDAIAVDPNGNKGVGSLLLNDGYMTITGISGENIRGIDVNPESSAYFGGGTLNLTNADICDGGEIEMTHMKEDSDMTVYLTDSNFYADNSFNMYDGTLEIQNGTLIVNTATGIYGGRIIIDNEAQHGIEVNNYFFLPEESTAYISVETDAETPILVKGTFHQMGGTVYTDNCLREYPGMISIGATLLNGGTLEVNGRVGFTQTCDLEWPDPDSRPGMMITGGEMIANGEEIGFLITGPVEWNGGTVRAHSNATADSWWQTALKIEDYTGHEGEGISYLKINGGEHYLTADPASYSEQASKGLSAVYAPVFVNGGIVHIDAERALWSLSNEGESNISSELGVVNFLSVNSDAYLDLHGEVGADYIETLVEEDGTYSGTVVMTASEADKAPVTQTRLEEMLSEAAANGTNVVLKTALTLTRDLDVIAPLHIYGGELNVPEGITLINSAESIAVDASGKLNVSGDLVNNANCDIFVNSGCSMTVNGMFENYGFAHVTANAVMNITEGATFYNYGYWNVEPAATVNAAGEVYNSVDSEDPQSAGFMELHGTVNVRNLYNGRNIVIGSNGVVNVSSLLENNSTLILDEGGKLYVAEDADLLNLAAQMSVAKGTLTVDGDLYNNGWLFLDEGTVTVADEGYHHYESASCSVDNFDGTLVTIQGIGHSFQTLSFQGNNAAQFVALNTEMGNHGYAGAIITIEGTMNLNQNVVLGSNVDLYVGTPYASATLNIAGGKTMTLYGNLNVTQTGTVNVNGILKNYGGISVSGTLVKPVGGTVSNGTYMNVYAGGRVTANGDNWIGYQPLKMEEGAVIEGTAMGMTQAKFQQALAEAAANDYAFELNEVVTLSSNMAINALLKICDGGGIVVPKGITLTVNSEWLEVNENGFIIVDGTFTNNASFWLHKGSWMEVNGTAINNKWFQVGRDPYDLDSDAVLDINGTFNNYQDVHFYESAVVNVNQNAVFNGNYKTDDNQSFRGYVHVYGGQLNISGTVNNKLGIGVQEGGEINVNATGTLKNIFPGNVMGELRIGDSGTVNVMGTFVNELNTITSGSNAQLLTYPGSKVTNNGWMSNEYLDSTMDLSQAEFVHNEEYYLTTRYFEDGSVSIIEGVPNEYILLHLYHTSDEDVINSMSQYGYDNGYLAQIIHMNLEREIDGELILQPGTEFLVSREWDNEGNPLASHLIVSGKITTVGDAGIFVQDGCALTIAESGVIMNLGRVIAWEDTMLEVNGMLVNDGGYIYTEGDYQLGENGQIWNVAYGSNLSVIEGIAKKDQHMDVYLFDGHTAANMTTMLNQIKTYGYRGANIEIHTDLAFSALEIPANVTVGICGQWDENDQIIPTTVTVNGKLTNNGEIIEYEGGRLVLNGILVGNVPVDEYGSSDFISQENLEEMLLESDHVYLDKRVFVTAPLDITGTLNIVDGGELIIAQGGSVNLTGRIELYRDYISDTPGKLNVQLGGKLLNNGEIIVRLAAEGSESPVVDMKGTYTHGITNTGATALVWSDYSKGRIPAINGIAQSYQSLSFGTNDETEISSFFTFAAGYAEAEVYVVADVTLQNNLTIPANGIVIVDSYTGEQVTFTIPAGVTLTNNGKLIVYDANLVVEGTILGNEPVVDPENTNLMTQSQFIQELSEAVSTGAPYILDKRVVITKDMTLHTNAILDISGGELVVTNGAELTNNGTIVASVNDGKILVEDGSKFNNNGTLYIDSDGVQLAAGTYVHGAKAKVYVAYTDAYDGTEIHESVVSVEGIDKSYQTLLYERYDMNCDLAERFFETAQGYPSGVMKVTGGEMIVDRPLTIPANITIIVGEGNPYARSANTVLLTIDNGGLYNDGELHLDPLCRVVSTGLIVNNGKLNIACEYINNGSIVNYGNLTNSGNITSDSDEGERVIFSVPGGVTNRGSIDEDMLLYRTNVTTEAQLQSAAAAGVDIIIVDQDLTLTKSLTIPSSVELIVSPEVTVTVNTTGTITNNGHIMMSGNLIVVKGNLQGNQIAVVGFGEIEAPEGSFVRVGVAPEAFDFTANMLVAPTNIPVELSIANVQPMGADFLGYEFEIVDGVFGEAEIKELNKLYSPVGGEVTVRAKIILKYDENGDPVYGETTEEITIQFVEQGISYSYNANAFDGDMLMLSSGSKVVYNGHITEIVEQGQIPERFNLTNTTLVWSLAEGDDAFATLTVKGDQATVTAKAVTEQHTVHLNVAAADGSAFGHTFPISIRPKLEAINLLKDGETVTGKTITFDLSGSSQSMNLAIEATPSDAYDENMQFFMTNGYVGAATWTSSNETIATVNEETGLIEFQGQTGTVTITATTNGAVRKTAKVTINVIRTPDNIEIVDPATELIGGQSKLYKVQGIFVQDDGTEEAAQLLSTAVVWNLVDEEGHVVEADPYASITAQGNLTTKAVEAYHTVGLQATYTIGETVMTTETLKVTLYPALNAIEILDDGNVVNGKTLLNDLGAVLSAMQLSVAGYPEHDSIKDIQWKSSNTLIAAIDADGNITATGTPGTVTFTATVKDHKGTTKTASVKVTYAVLVKELELTDAAGEALPETMELRALEKMTFGYQVRASLEELVPANKAVSWTVSNIAAATVSSAGLLTAKAVNNPVTVTVTATAKDGSGVSTSYDVTVLPKLDSQQREALLLTLVPGDPTEADFVTKTTQLVESSKDDPKTLQLYSFNGTAATWTTSNENVATVDENGLVTVVGAGTANITATAEDGRTAVVTIKGTKLSADVEITAKNSLEENAFVVASGKTLSLTGTVTYTDGTTDKNVTWSVTDIEANATTAAKISTSGVLTATANLTEETTVYVQARAKDGIAPLVTCAVVIKPLATGVQILNDGNDVLNNLKMAVDFGGNGISTLQLKQSVIYEASCQNVKWASSNKAIATVDENGLVTFLNAGTVNITATTVDGSNKKATVTLVVSKLMTSLDVIDASVAVLGGKSIKLASNVVVDAEATNKKLVWSIESGDDFATINATTGELKAKNVTTVQHVLVRVVPADGSDLSQEIDVTIYPATTAVEIWQSVIVDEQTGETVETDVTGDTIVAYDGQQIDLIAKSLPADTMMGEGAAKWSWTSSDGTGSVVVDQNGRVSVIGGGVTATITAKATDGTNKTATVKIKTIQPVESIDFEQDLSLAGGMSLNLAQKVTFNFGGTQPTNKTLTWEVAPEFATYASISTSGVLKANKIDVPKTIEVIATATDGTDVSGQAFIDLWPATTKLQIMDENDAVITANVPMYLKNSPAVTTLNVLTTPAGAMQNVKWTVAAKDQAYVTLLNEYGEEVAEYVGAKATVMGKVGGKTITVTATTLDGTNKKATVKVQTFQLVNEINAENQVLAGGKSLNLNTVAAVNSDATNKKLNWEFVNPADKEFATLSSGTLKAVKLNDKAQPVTVEVRATAADYGAFSKTVLVTILPAITKLDIKENIEDEVSLNGKTIDLYLGGETSEHPDRIVLNVLATPEAAMYETENHRWAVKWTVPAKDLANVALLDDDGNEVAEYYGSNATVVAKVGGKTVTLTATSMDGTKKTATVKVKTTQLVTDMTIDDQILGGGRSLTLAKLITFNAEGAQPTSTKVEWSIVSGEGAKFNSTKTTLTADKVTEETSVTLMAAALDGSGVTKTCNVTILPATTALNIRNNGEIVSGKTVTLSLGSGQGLEIAQLDIQTTPIDRALQSVKWTIAAKDQQYVTLMDGNEEVTEFIGSSVNVKALVGGKTVAVKATSLDGTNISKTVNVKTVQLVTDMTIADQTLGSGLTLNLANLITFNEGGAQPTNTKVVWSVDGEGAKLNAAKTGLIADKDGAGKTVTLTATAQDESGLAQSCKVTILPVTTALQITSGEDVVTGKTIKLHLGAPENHDTLTDSVTLNALVTPEDAMGEVKWSVSAADAAYVELDSTVSEAVTVKAIKGGKTVTLTATAVDGSNKRATVRIQTVQLMDDMTLLNQPVGETIHVAAGRTMALKVTALPTNAANKTVTWEIVGGEGADYVTLTAAGSLKVNSGLPYDMELVVRATAKDDGKFSKDFTVKLYAQPTLSIRLTADQTTIAIGDFMNLNAMSLPYAKSVMAAQEWLWTSSNVNIATVNESGEVEALAKGTVTITCKAVDGTGKSAQIKLTIVEPVEDNSPK